jgi:hypothetical protein
LMCPPPGLANMPMHIKTEVKKETLIKVDPIIGSTPKNMPHKKAHMSQPPVRIKIEQPFPPRAPPASKMSFVPSLVGDGDLLEAHVEVSVLNVFDSDEEEFCAGEDVQLSAINSRSGIASSSSNKETPLSVDRINVYSCGWSHQGCAWKRRIEELIPELSHRLSVRYKRLEYLDLFMDCKKFYQAPPYSGHIGSHELELNDFVYNHHFEPWLRVVKAEVMKLETHGDGGERRDRTLAIICVCKAGRNRSVSGKTVLNYIFDKAGYKTNPDIGHLSKSGWSSARHRVCSDCVGCVSETAWKAATLRYAFRMYNCI